MQKIKCKSVKELKTFKPCEEAMAFIESCGSFRKAWNTCNNTSWMLWFLTNVENIEREYFPSLAKQFSNHVKHLNNPWSKHVAAANAAGAAAFAAGAAVGAAAYAAANAVGAAAYAAANAAGAAAERKWQCDLIRFMFKL